MRDILKRIFIGVAVGMALFFLKSEVFAATCPTTTNTYDARYSTDYTASSSSRNVVLNSLGSYVGTESMGTAILQPSYSGQYEPILTELSLKFYSSTGFVAGNTYSLVVRVNTSSDYVANTYKNNANIRTVRGGTSTSNLSESYIDSFVLDRIAIDESNDKVFYIYFSFTVKSTSNYVWTYVQLLDKNVVYDSTLDVTNVNVVTRFSSCSYSEGANSYIQQVNNSIIKLIRATISGNQDIMDADAPASKDFNNDYSVTAYDQAEYDISQYQNADVHNFLFDPNTWQSSFAVVWRIVEDFVFISNKVFGAITAILVLSFVGLVMGR